MGKPVEPVAEVFYPFAACSGPRPHKCQTRVNSGSRWHVCNCPCHKKELTLAQRKWVADYKRLTGFEATMRRDELDAGKISFGDFALRNTDWLRQWVNDTMQRLERGLPDE